MMRCSMGAIRRRLRYNKYVVMLYNFFVNNLCFRLKDVDRMMKKNGFVYSEKKLKSKFYLPHYKDDLIQRSILMNRNYFEYDLLWNLAFTWNGGLLGKKIKGKAMLDIGANIGNHTLFFMNECCVAFSYCFEPIKNTFDILENNIRINGLSGKVCLFNIAIGEKNGNASIAYFDPKNLGGTNLKKQDDGQIKIVPIDALGINDEIAFVKIDVEGFELNVILGMQGLLKSYHPIIFIEIRDCFYNEINAILIAMGYNGELIEKMYGLNCSNYIYY